MSCNHRTGRARAAAAAGLAAALLLSIALPATADRADLNAFLERAHRMCTFNGPARADISITYADGKTDEAVLIVSPGEKRQFLAFKSSGWRALMPMGWGNGKAVKAAGGEPVAFSADEPLAGSDVRAMEFFPFWETDYSTAFISDSSRLAKTITLYAPDEVPYILFVITFDKARLVPLATKYYKDEMNNLVRLRSDSDHVMVGSRPRPQKIEITDYDENRTTTLALSWRTLDQVPAGVTSDASFHKAEIEWAGETVASN